MASSSSSATTTTAVLAPSIPKATLSFLNADGTVSLAWYRFLQSLTGNQSTIVTNVSGVATTINNITTTISGTTSIATEALDLAQSLEALNFLGASKGGAMTGALDLGPNAGPVDPFAFIGQVVDPRPRNTPRPRSPTIDQLASRVAELENNQRPRNTPRPRSPTIDQLFARLNDLEFAIRPRNVPRPKSPDITRLAIPPLDQPPVKVSTGSGLISNHLKSLTFGTGTTATSDVAGNVTLSVSSGSALSVIANGSTLTTAATALTFTGAGVIGSISGTDATLTIPGSSGALAAVSCSLSGTTITVDRATNVASVTRTAAGRYRLTFTTALSISTYGVAATGQYPTESGVLPIAGIDATSGYGATTTTLDVAFETAAGVFADLAYFTVLIFDPANFTGGSGGVTGQIPGLFGPPSVSTFPNLVGPSSPALSVGSVTGGLTLTVTPANGTLSANYAWTAPPTAPWTVIARILGEPILNSNSSYGLVLGDGSGKFITFDFGGGSTLYEIQVVTWNNTTSVNSVAAQYYFFNSYQYFKITNNGTTLTFYISLDGDNWINIYSASVTFYLSAVNEIGIGNTTENNNAPSGFQQYVNCVYWNLTTP